MNDLQIGLLILGLLVIGGVVAFNWWQERQFRQRSERAFSRTHSDVLLEPRVEPAAPAADESWLGDNEPAATTPSDVETAPAMAEPIRSGTGTSVDEAVAVDAGASRIDYVAELRAGENIPASAINALETALADIDRPVTLTGYEYHARRWEPINGPDHWYTSLRIGLQLVDRNGTATLDQIRQLGSIVREHAAQLSAIAELPDPERAMRQAADLDEFCADVDVIVGINVIAQTGQVFHGTQLRALAESQGLKLQPSGVFVYPGEGGRPLFTLDNQDSRPFRSDQLRHLTTTGVTFLLDVPRTGDGIKVFDRMVTVSRQFAESLDGMLADDNKALLNDVGLDKIRNQLRAIYAMMEHRGIPAGSKGAQRLFS